MQVLLLRCLLLLLIKVGACRVSIHVSVEAGRLIEVVGVHTHAGTRARAAALAGGEDALGEGPADADAQGLVEAVD